MKNAVVNGALEGDLARVTETVELVQLAKTAGVPRGAINTCFDNEELRELIRKAQEAPAAAEAPIQKSIVATVRRCIASGPDPAVFPGWVPSTRSESGKYEPPWISHDLEQVLSDYFVRYDLDGSGTFNSNAELKQLCTNLAVKLELDMDVQAIDQMVNRAGDMEELCWDFKTFKKWFVSKEQFAPSPFWLQRDYSDSDDAPENEMEGFLKAGSYKVNMRPDGHAGVEFEIKVRYTRGGTEEVVKELVSRTYCDETLGMNTNQGHPYPYGLNTVSGQVNNTDKTIHFEKAYQHDESSGWPRFVFNGKATRVATRVEGSWVCEGGEHQACTAVLEQLNVGARGSFTMIKNPKID